MSYIKETYLGVAILIPTNIEESKFEQLMDDTEGLEYFPRREEVTDYWYFTPYPYDNSFTKHWTEHSSQNMTEILDDFSIKNEIEKFERLNERLIEEIKSICPEMKISFVCLTGGS